MLVSGKTTLFISLNGKEGNLFKTYSASVYHADKEEKGENTSYINGYIEVRFSKECLNEEREKKLDPKNSYQMDITKGFLDVRSYKDKNGKDKKVIYLFVTECSFSNPKALPEKDIRLQGNVDNNSF